MVGSKYRKIICMSFVLGALPFCTAFATTGKIDGNAVRLRKEPSTSSKIITLLEKGKSVEILKEDSDWYQIKASTNTGWVSKSLITGISGEVPGAKVNSVVEPIPTISQGNESAQTTENIVVSVVGNSVNLRSGPTTSSSIVGKVVKGDNLVASEKTADGLWYKIKFGDIEGYVYAEYVTADVSAIKGTGKINDSVNFRTSPSTDADIISKLSTGTSVTITDVDGDWYKVVSGEKEGWIVARCVDRVTSTSRSGSNTTAQKVVELARQQLGKKYVWAANGPNSFDCSGLTKYVFGKVGITLERVSYNQATQGVKVTKDSLVPGDLVFFSGINASSSSKQVSHVGIYIGNGQFIHASNPTRGVVTDELSSEYYAKHYVTARRVIR